MYANQMHPFLYRKKNTLLMRIYSRHYKIVFKVIEKEKYKPVQADI
jgi:hypothetical protein